eukprot:CAMPEP_0197720626 /NCGR_PEP_ID=MMETSP1434-20131217/3931_2 /TAXON_ID=265543 /ORGANISM="Minutocellus polymorphus, Strain CCMP3303" /LENGTH=70 /DNA_ID=CAMNT_0043305513 /DNA_START=144 /DNA_END=354 /DNA_ORIENTATION=-
MNPAFKHTFTQGTSAAGTQIDLGPSQLGAEVVHVGTEEYRGGGEQTDDDGRTLALLGGAGPDDAALPNDL